MVNRTRPARLDTLYIPTNGTNGTNLHYNFNWLHSLSAFIALVILAQIPACGYGMDQRRFDGMVIGIALAFAF